MIINFVEAAGECMFKTDCWWCSPTSSIHDLLLHSHNACLQVIVHWDVVQTQRRFSSKIH